MAHACEDCRDIGNDVRERHGLLRSVVNEHHINVVLTLCDPCYRLRSEMEYPQHISSIRSELNNSGVG
jgi:hypothetical protein